jgi:hypothetical protein
MSHGLGETKGPESIKNMVENEKCDAKVSIINYLFLEELFRVIMIIVHLLTQTSV